MPNNKDKCFNIAKYMMERKEARRKIVEEHRTLSKERKKIERIQAKIVKAKEKKDALMSDLPNSVSHNSETRTRSPTVLQDGVPNLPTRTGTKRRQEMMKAASAIHGASQENLKPALDGMFDTLQKRCKTETLANYVLSDESLTKAVLSKCCKKELTDFEKSDTNVERSIATFYSNGVMGKRKYQSVKLVLSMTSGAQGGRTGISVFPGCKVPKLLTYNNLIREIKKIDIGKVYEIDSEYLNGLELDEHVPINGAYRDLREYLPRLAECYLSANRKHTLEWYGKTDGTFLVALGGDGCPFGKHENACSFLASFLNVGRKVASSYDNFCIFGANCDETSLVVKRYARSLVHQVAELEKTVFQVGNCVTITFKVQELPNDMKMLAMLAGELVISAKYFSPFANVCTDDAADLQASFGLRPENKWQPWKYEQRVSVVAKVESFKQKLDKKPLSSKVKRSKVTEFIASQKSRQEFLPLLGKYVEQAHVEPLHLKNNAWQYFFKFVLKEAIRKSKLPAKCKTFAEVPEDSIFARLIRALEIKVKTKRLSGKVKRWFDETQGSGPDLLYRFTGKDSRRFCHNYTSLVNALTDNSDTKQDRLTLLVFIYLGMRLRDCVSLMNRFDIKEEEIAQLTLAAQEYLRVNAMFLPTAVNPTVWTLGNVVPVHARQVFAQYNKGLALVTMEGREAKHIFLKTLSQNTTYQRRWLEILKHEYIMLIWLPEHGYQLSCGKSHNETYIPSRVFDNSSYCYCGHLKNSPDDAKCKFCQDPLMRLIEKSVTEGKIDMSLKK